MINYNPGWVGWLGVVIEIIIFKAKLSSAKLNYPSGTELGNRANVFGWLGSRMAGGLVDGLRKWN